MSDILIYQNESGNIKAIFEEGELNPISTVRHYRTIQMKKTV